MSHSSEKHNEDSGLLRSKAFRLLGNLDPIPSLIVFGCLIAIAVGLITIGAAVAYELTTSIWAAPVGVALGLSLAVLLGRDFLRWRLSWVSIVAVGLFCFLFVVAYW
jgi:hypothetical protein